MFSKMFMIDMLLKMIIFANFCIIFLTKMIPKNYDAFRCPINFRESLSEVDRVVYIYHAKYTIRRYMRKACFGQQIQSPRW